MLSPELAALEAEVMQELAVETAAPAIVASEVKTLEDLDDLLAESMVLRDERHAGKGLREKLAKAKDETERQEIELTLRAWEAKYEWDTVAECLVIHRQKCRCGNVHEHFAGIYLHQRHRTDKHAQRWINSLDNVVQAVRELQAADLPKQTFVEAKAVPICYRCAAEQGFPLPVFGVPWK